MSIQEIRQGRKRTVAELVDSLRHFSISGVRDIQRDGAILREAADALKSLAEYKINHLPPPTDRDWALMLEECTLRGARIRELEKQLAEARREGPLIGKAATVYCCEEKTVSGLIEED